MRCSLCGGAQFTEHISGDMVCIGCGAVIGGPPEPWGDDTRLDALDLERDLQDELEIEQYEWR